MRRGLVHECFDQPMYQISSNNLNQNKIVGIKAKLISLYKAVLNTEKLYTIIPSKTEGQFFCK